MTLALRDGRVIISADTDFGALLAHGRATKPSVILVRALIDRRPPELAGIIAADLDGERMTVVLPRTVPRPTRTGDGGHPYARRVHLDLVTLVVDDYDPAIAFYTQVLGLDLVEDLPALTTDGRPKRWVVVRPPGARTGLLLARADGTRQAATVGNQTADRVGFFLHVDDFTATHQRLAQAGVEFVRPPRTEPYGQVAVFRDLAGNRWDLLGPAGHPPDHAGDDTDADLDTALAQEQELLRTECRRDRHRLTALLHPDFLEVGASGTTWTRDQVLDRLPADPDLPATATDLRAHRLGADTVLVTFHLHRHDGGSSHRSSTWLRTDDGRWQLRFHQGTPTAGA